MYAAFQASNDRLEELRGQRSLFDLDKQILQHNLYGVDLNEEAVEICRLSLWIKTAQRGKPLTSLDHNIRVGNSVIADLAVHPKAFDWQVAFPEVFGQGGFDVVVGNPPYVRQEWISPYKTYFRSIYKSFHSSADLYVYFYELGINLLKPGGRLSFVVTNKWLKAGYGEPLRRFLSEETWIESVVDFGHAKQIFPDADVFPTIIVTRRPGDETAPDISRVCAIPRDQLRINDLKSQIESEGIDINRSRLGSEAWSLDPKTVMTLYAKIREAGQDLSLYADVKPLTGIKTALNEAYLIDTATKKRLIDLDPKASEILKPYVRGSDISRWGLEWAGLWMIALKSSGDYPWPWSNAGEAAESVFKATYPSVYDFMKGHENGLRKRQDQGRYWWELRSCAYWDLFNKPKLYLQLIQYYPCYAFDDMGFCGNNKTSFIPTQDLYLLGVLNSPLMWWYNWRYLPHMKDEALAPNPTVMEKCPIARPTDELRDKIEKAVGQAVSISKSQFETIKSVLDWLKVEHGIEKPTKNLQCFLELGSDAFVVEVRKIRGKKNPLSLAALRNLREEHQLTILPAQALVVKMRVLENEISALVNAAYGLTPSEISLMWETAPPRMPIVAA